jgi:hypothetical protein
MNALSAACAPGLSLVVHCYVCHIYNSANRLNAKPLKVCHQKWIHNDDDWICLVTKNVN